MGAKVLAMDQRSDETPDIWVDFMTMTNAGRLWTGNDDVRPGFVPIAGEHAIVGCEDAFPAVARISTVDGERGIELEFLDGSVEEHRALRPPDRRSPS